MSERKILNKSKHIIAVFLTITLFLGLMIPAMTSDVHAASKQTRSSVATSHVTGNASVANLPAAADLTAGKTYYVNIQTNNWKVTEMTLYVKAPGSSGFTRVGTERASNYITYAWLPYKFTKAGTYQYYWHLRSKDDGKLYTSGTKTVTVKSASGNTGSSYDQKVASFLSDSRFKNGISWGSGQTPKLSSYGSSGCCAYAADFVKYVFNKDNPRKGTRFTATGSVRAGDVLHLNPNHWIVVLSRSGNTLRTAEGNASGKVVVSNSKYRISGNYIKSSYSSYRIADGYHFK